MARVKKVNRVGVENAAVSDTRTMVRPRTDDIMESVSGSRQVYADDLKL